MLVYFLPYEAYLGFIIHGDTSVKLVVNNNELIVNNH